MQPARTSTNKNVRIPFFTLKATLFLGECNSDGTDLIVSALTNGKTFPMDLLKTILTALVDLDRTVKTMAISHPKPNLLPLFARLDELTAQLPPDTDPTLLHYLHKKSYEKARLFLEGREAENQAGNCRHV